MYDYQKIAKALIRNADEIVAAIDRYIAKKDEDLKKTLKTEGYADPDGTVGAINDLEEAVAGILADQQQDLLNTLKEAEEAGDTGEQLKKRIDTMLENDSIHIILSWCRRMKSWYWNPKCSVPPPIICYPGRMLYRYTR